MPGSTKAKWAQLRVGLMAIIALSLLGYLIFLMSGSQGFFRSRTDVYTFMDDSAAIVDGAPVRLNGITVGKVAHVGLSGSAEPRRIVRLTLQIDSDYLPSIPVDSQATIAAENLLGTKYINIKKGRSSQTIKAGAEIASLDTREFDEVVQQGYTALSSLDGILKKLDGILNAVQVGHGTIGKLLVDETLYNKVLAIADEGQKLTVSLNNHESSIGRLLHDDQLYQDIRGSVTRINTLLDGVNNGEGTLGKLAKDPAIYDDTRSTIADVRKLLAGLDQGQGTMGKLLKSDELHDQLKASMARLDTLLDKMNSGEGTIGQLLANPALYDALNGTTREMQGLLKDFRSNPKKFLHLKFSIF